MLSPSVNAAQSLLTQAFNEVLLLDGYATWTNNITIGVLPKEPDWLAAVRTEVGLLSAAGGQWILAKPQIWGPLLVQFTDYATAFAGVAKAKAQQPTADQWIALLSQVLLPQLAKSKAATSTASTALQKRYQAFRSIQPQLEASINAGWAELSDEEQQMVRIAMELTHLQDQLNALEDSVTQGDISTGKAVVTTTVKTLYNIATKAGESFSFLGMLTSAVTVGQFYYDLVTKTEEIGETLRQIADLQLEASEEAQAAAGTKLVLQLLYNLELAFGRIVDVLPQIITLWDTEEQKVQDAVNALKAGADPAMLFDLVTVNVANANWNAINGFSLALPTLKQQQGPPVPIDPQNPIAVN